jgi:hypothetical protein
LFVAGGQGFFVEDTWLITASGHERVNPSLPYTPSDIERAMGRENDGVSSKRRWRLLANHRRRDHRRALAILRPFEASQARPSIANQARAVLWPWCGTWAWR